MLLTCFLFGFFLPIIVQNNVRFNEPLVDEEGFPRNDIDVRDVRLARTQIVCLQNDLKLIMKVIEEGLRNYFEEQKDIPQTSSKLPQRMDVDETVQENVTPFLFVNLVTPDSPGSFAGIQLNDLILSFGTINFGNFSQLQQIGDLVKNSQNHQIKVKIRRNGTQIELILVPKIWSGQGLLGFKVAPLPN